MKELAVAIVCILSWLGGGGAYWAVLNAVFGERSSRADFSPLGFWTLLLVVLLLPFHIRTVKILTQLSDQAGQRFLRALGWALLTGVGSAMLLSALTRQGRILDVFTPEGSLLLAWFSATAILFGTLGAAAHRLHLWIEPPQDHAGN